MKRVAILVPIILALGLLLLPAAVSAAGIEEVAKTGDGFWTGDTWQVDVYPGETKVTAITLHNSSSSALEVEATILPESLDGGNLTFELDKASFNMPGISYTDVTLSVTANGSATPGTYTTELTIKFEIPSTGGGSGGSSSGDNPPPRIYGSSLCGIAETTADICWTTNEWSTSQVEYWASPSKLSPLDETYVMQHHVQLTELTPGTLYQYKMLSEDKAGNLRVSDTHTFTTLGEAPGPQKQVPPPTSTPPPPTTPTTTTPPTTTMPIPEEPSHWGLYGSLLALSIAGGIGYWVWRRRRKEACRV